MVSVPRAETPSLITFSDNHATLQVHNSYYILQKAHSLPCCSGGILSHVTAIVVQAVFASSYIVVRALIAPPFFIYMTWDMWANKNAKVPYWLLCIWTFLIWGVLFGSLPWVAECLTMLKDIWQGKGAFADLPSAFSAHHGDGGDGGGCPYLATQQLQQ